MFSGNVLSFHFSECEKFNVDVKDSKLLAVVGREGIGKSALMAKLAVQMSAVSEVNS